MNLSLTSACDSLSCAWHRLPSVEALRKVSALTQTAVREAARHRTFQASFHGFYIYASRQPLPCGVWVTVRVVYGATWCVTGVNLAWDSFG